MTTFTDSIEHITSLNRASGTTWTDATKRKASHKPLLLLAVLDLVHHGVIISPIIDVADDLVELNELFSIYWRQIIPLGWTSSIAFPFSRLDRELVPQPGKTITPAVINNTSYVTYLRKYALGTRLDEVLFHIMQSGEGREALQEALLQSCFSWPCSGAVNHQPKGIRQRHDGRFRKLWRDHITPHLRLGQRTQFAADPYRPQNHPTTGPRPLAGSAVPGRVSPRMALVMRNLDE